MGRLTRMSQFHIAKLDDKAAKNSEIRIAEIWNRIKWEIPAYFNLRQQTLFAQGYYQQKAETIQNIMKYKEFKKFEAENESTDNN